MAYKNAFIFTLSLLVLGLGGPQISQGIAWAKKSIAYINIANEEGDRVADVFTTGGATRLAVDANISSVNVPLGKDPLPDTYFRITQAGQAGDTLTTTIQATNYDPSSPLQNFPLYTSTYTLVSADVGDERQLAINYCDSLNSDPLFEAQELECNPVADDKRPVIHITSLEFSLNGEDYERPNVGDFEVVPSGTTTIFIEDDFRRIVSRPKEVSLGRDPNNPHRLGVQAISGTVFIRSSDPDKVIRERIKEVGNPTNFNLAVNGSTTPVVFEFSANIDGEPDRIIDSLKFFGNDGNIKTQISNFLGLNSSLSTGLLVEFVREGNVIFSRNIRNTVELFGVWSTSGSDNKIIGQSGGDYFESTFSLIDKNLAFVLENGEDSKIRVTVRDDLRQVDALYLLIDGSED